MILTWIIATFWKNQNWLGKIQSICIVLLVLLMMYFKALFGIYKHKYVSNLEEMEVELQLEIDNLEELQSANNNRQKRSVFKLKTDKNLIDKKRKKDEETINNAVVTDIQRNAIISKYEAK
ncbi:hypothetical protein [Tenacibaculum finnmarkense]|uniref:hypothetical protein n=1 Tax=Tenacibaculum finnmarkense TaxID=2781243 RepID=UPI00187B218E|nr:hypothetical protein [Tenacibaculum finnmarkense]MBE7649310.1 hypothetical protein [Tenacibaculum finnmarkense genomovar ulcerans]